MPATQEQKRHYAIQARELNDKVARRYFYLIKDGTPREDAREVVKEAFGIKDRRLDNLLDTRAGQFSPGTVAELEAIATTYIQRLDNSIDFLCRHCDRQLDRLDNLADVDENGEPNWVSIELIEETSKRDFKVRKKKMTVADAIRILGEAKLGYNQKLLDGLKALKADTIINISRGEDISALSAADLETRRKEQVKQREGRIVDAEYTVEQ